MSFFSSVEEGLLSGFKKVFITRGLFSDIMSLTLLSQLVNDIRQKKELRGIDEAFVLGMIARVANDRPASRKYIAAGQANPKSAIHRQLIKEVRARLRRVVGLFTSSKDLQELLDRLCQTNFQSSASRSLHQQLLSRHPSTSDRVSWYPQWYRQLWRITGKPTVILDLGCGLHPFSFRFMGLQKLNYYAYDINQTNLQLLDRYFAYVHQQRPDIQGKTTVLDMTKELRSLLPPADVAFLLKMTDVLELKKGHKITEHILSQLPAKWVVISFSTVTLSGKPMNYPGRKWIELLCQRLGYSFSVLTFPTEIFYVIKKKES